MHDCQRVVPRSNHGCGGEGNRGSCAMGRGCRYVSRLADGIQVFRPLKRRGGHIQGQPPPAPNRGPAFPDSARFVSPSWLRD